MICRRIILIAWLGLIVPAALAQDAKPLLLHLLGVAGEATVDHRLMSGLKDGGLDAEYVIHDWTAGDPGIPALLSRQRNEAESAKVAVLIEDALKRDPMRRIILTSHSGGGGIAVWALERLPDGMQVESLYLIAPALSPAYDLTKALRHVKNKAYVFSSTLDVAVLGAGTRLLGTIDGVRTDAAGLNGFAKPPTADAAQYAKLVPLPYRSEWLRLYGNDGSHISPMGSTFAKEFIAPIMLTGKVSTPATLPAAN